MNGVMENRTGAWAQLASFGLDDAPSKPVTPPERPTRSVRPVPETLHVLSTLDEVRIATANVLGSAQRLISIMTPDLEPDLYEQPQLLESLKYFVLSRSFAKVRVLVRNQSHLTGGDNRFVTMARRLTSYLEIRIRANQYSDLDCAYCIADDRAILYRLRADRWDGIAGFNNPAIARQYLQNFDAIWQDSAQEHQQLGLRRQG